MWNVIEVYVGNVCWVLPTQYCKNILISMVIYLLMTTKNPLSKLLIVYKKLTIWFYLEHLPLFSDLCVDDPEQNAGTIHASNPEHLTVFKAPRRDNLEHNGGTIHATNPEHLLVFKALCGDNPEQSAGKIHASDREYLEQNAGMIHWELYNGFISQGCVSYRSKCYTHRSNMIWQRSLTTIISS